MNNNKRLIENYHNTVWNTKNLDIIKDLFHERAVIHSLFGKKKGPEVMKEIVQMWQKGFPDIHVLQIGVIAEHDIVVVHWEAKGTHLGEFKGIQPTKKRVNFSGVTIYRLENAKIVEYWAYIDMSNFMTQIGTYEFLKS